VILGKAMPPMWIRCADVVSRGNTKSPSRHHTKTLRFLNPFSVSPAVNRRGDKWQPYP
jgi:hypothetical protein